VRKFLNLNGTWVNSKQGWSRRLARKTDGQITQLASRKSFARGWEEGVKSEKNPSVMNWLTGGEAKAHGLASVRHLFSHVVWVVEKGKGKKKTQKKINME